MDVLLFLRDLISVTVGIRCLVYALNLRTLEHQLTAGHMTGSELVSHPEVSS